jgi:hypothetical protein
VESSCECGYEPSGSIKYWETIKWLHNWWPLEWLSVPHSYLDVCVEMGSKVRPVRGADIREPFV